MFGSKTYERQQAFNNSLEKAFNIFYHLKGWFKILDFGPHFRDSLGVIYQWRQF